MTVTRAPRAAKAGPSDPLNPVGEPEIRSQLPGGSQVVRQRYQDGCLYEYKVETGVNTFFDPADISPFFRGTILCTFRDERFNYISVWLPDGPAGCQCPENLGHEDRDLPYGDLLSAEIETVHIDEKSGQSVTRMRYTRGTMYFILVHLGRPWTGPPKEVRDLFGHGLLVGTTQIGRLSVITFWVPEAGTAVEAA